MNIRRADCRPYSLPLRQNWNSHPGSLQRRDGLLIRLLAGDRCGHGDCAPLPTAGTETLDAARDWLRDRLPRLRGLPPEAALQALPDAERSPPAARCGLETALIDLCAQEQGLPVARWLNPDAASEVRANAVLGALDPGVFARAERAVAQGFDLLKVKLGVASDPQCEIAELERLSARLPSGASLRLDANKAWSESTAALSIQSLKRLPVEALEEPLADPEPAALAALQALAPFPLAVDESLCPATFARLTQIKAVRRVVIKPMRTGGLLPALAIARRARDHAMQSVITTTVDSAWGVAAALHLAAALPQSGTLSHGLATSEWLNQDLTQAPAVHRGRMRVPSAPGLGLRPPGC